MVVDDEKIGTKLRLQKIAKESPNKLNNFVLTVLSHKLFQTSPGYKTFIMLNSTEHVIQPSHKC